MIRKNRILLSLFVFLVFFFAENMISASDSPSLQDNPGAQEQYYLALTHFRDGEYASALAKFSDVVNNYPKTEAAAKAQRKIGAIYLILGDTEQALTAHKKSSTIDPENSAVWIEIGNLYEEINKPNEAIEAYKKAVSLISQKKERGLEIIPLYEKIGSALFDEKKYNEAISYYNDALALDENGKYRNRYNMKAKMALIYEHLNKFDEAEKLYRELISERETTEYILSLAKILVNRKSDTEVFDLCINCIDKLRHSFLHYRGTGIQVMIGKYYIDSNRIEDWLAFLQKKTGESTSNTYACILIAGIYEAKKNADNAAHYYEMALKNMPAGDKYSSLKTGLLKIAASSHLNASKYAKAAELFLELSKVNTAGYFNPDWISEQLALCYLKNGEVDRANSIFEELREKHLGTFNKDKYRKDYLKIYIEQGNDDAALDLMLASMEKPPQYYRYSGHSLIKEYESLGKVDLLITSLKNRIQKEPNNTLLYLILGGYYDRQRECTSALEYYEKLQELVPAEINIYKTMESLYSSTNNSPKRLWCYERIIELAPNNPQSVEYYIRLAYEYSHRVKKDDALKILKKLFGHHKITDPDHASDIANIYKWMHMYKDAIPFYQQALEEGVYGSIYCTVSLGECYYELGDHERAKELLEAVVASGSETESQKARALLWNINHPNSREIRAFPLPEQHFVFRAKNVKMTKSRFEKLMKEYKDSTADERIIIKQEVVATGLHLAKIMVEQSRASEALPVLMKLPDVTPERSDVCNAIADLYFYYIPNSANKAIKMYKESLEREPSDIHALLHLGYALERKGDYKKAKKYYSELINVENKVNKYFWYKIAETRVKGLELIEKKQLIKDWLIIGPFDNKENKGLDTVYPPEEAFKIDATYKGKNNLAVKWTRPYKGKYGFVDFDEIFAPNNDNAVAYAVLYIVSPDARDVQFKIGGDESLAVWLNEEIILSHRGSRWTTLDYDTVKVNLKEGKNTVLVKVSEGTMDWGFHFRITAKNGAHIDDVQYIIPE